MTIATPNSDSISVMLVDDSAVIRGLMSRALKTRPELNIVATASDGEMAIQVLKQHRVDVIILDIEMPKMDGLTALPSLREISPHSAVLIASTLSQRNAEISMRAMELGAADYIPKPSSQDGASVAEQFYEELRQKVYALGMAARKGRFVGGPSAAVSAAVATEPRTPAISTYAAAKAVFYPPQKIRAIAIAASTGGPQALSAVLHGLKGSPLNMPIFVTQHMPAKFTKMLADHLMKDTGFICREGVDKEVVQPGVLYVAPGDFHMEAKQTQQGIEIALNQSAPVNFCRPAADPMLESLSIVYRDALLTVILTGMGSDGLNGARKVVDAGGYVVAQDEETSVVWGMPGAVANAKLCKAILPLPQIAPYLARVIGGGHAAG